MRILIAPNAFKNSLDAGKAAEAISRGLEQSQLSCTMVCFPVADGGDGTGKLLSDYLQAERIEIKVHDPLDRMITSSFGWVNESNTAIIEMADASGLRLLDRTEYAPLRATSFGTGELIKAALAKKAEKIIVCIGGSATVDGGAGILQAVGFEFRDVRGKNLEGLPTSLHFLSSIIVPDLLKEKIPADIIVLCDVENLLTGPSGAAAVFGPQKGASEDDVRMLNAALSRFSDVALETTGINMSAIRHGGAAGGVAASLHTFLQAKLVNGIDQFLAMTDFEKEIKKADLVITGEGSLDAQTLEGKGPFGVARQAKQYGLPVIGMAGKIKAEKELLQYFTRLIAITPDDMDMQTALANTYPNLEAAAKLAGDQIASGIIRLTR